ncbi:MAG TPA: hypothetical protein VF795_03760 [Desulfuromonadaceae bacterium]
MTAMPANNLQNSLNILDDVVIPESQYGKPVGLQTGVSLHVVAVPRGVLATIKLNDEFLFKGHKVGNVPFNRLLSAEFDTFNLAVPQTSPEQTLHIRAAIS